MGMPLRVPTYTVDDVYAFPEDGNRYELLEGMLLVTPAPGPPHQVVLGRLTVEIGRYLAGEEHAIVVSPGAIEIAPKTLLQPDLLVYPATYTPDRKWSEIRDWWLAVEVFSRSSRVYDRDFKRDAYLALGVEEVWLVDLHEHAVLVSLRGGERDARYTERLRWRPAGMPDAFEIELRSLFRGVP